MKRPKLEHAAAPYHTQSVLAREGSLIVYMRPREEDRWMTPNCTTPAGADTDNMLPSCEEGHLMTANSSQSNPAVGTDGVA